MRSESLCRLGKGIGGIVVIAGMLILSLLFSCGKKKGTPPDPPGGQDADVIVPLAVGNYWIYTYLNPDGAPSGGTIELGITGDSTITYEESQYLVYFWNWFAGIDRPRDEFWLVNNQDDGLWMIGYVWNSVYSASYFPRLCVKYPADVGDTWEYIDRDDSLTMTCVSTGTMIETPAGTFECYVYHEEEYGLVYFAPGIGYVGHGLTVDGQDTGGFRLIEYHLESGGLLYPSGRRTWSNSSISSFAEPAYEDRESRRRAFKTPLG